MSAPIAPDDIVQTPAEAEGNSRPPLLVLEPLRAFLDAHGLGDGRAAGDPDRRGPLERHLPDRARRRRGSAAPPAAPTAAAERARRAARGASAASAAEHARTRARRAGRVRGPEHDRRAVLRDGADRGRGDRRQRARAAGHAGRTSPHQRAADRLARGDPRCRLARGRARRLRQADRLPRTPAAAFRRALGAQQDA